MNNLTLSTYLAGLFGGGGTFIALKFIFNELKEAGVVLTRLQKRGLAYLFSLLISTGALAVAVYFGYAQFTPDTTFVAFATAFSASQAFHATELDPPKPPEPISPRLA